MQKNHSSKPDIKEAIKELEKVNSSLAIADVKEKSKLLNKKEILENKIKVDDYFIATIDDVYRVSYLLANGFTEFIENLLSCSQQEIIIALVDEYGKELQGLDNLLKEIIEKGKAFKTQDKFSEYLSLKETENPDLDNSIWERLKTYINGKRSDAIIPKVAKDITKGYTKQFYIAPLFKRLSKASRTKLVSKIEALLVNLNKNNIIRTVTIPDIDLDKLLNDQKIEEKKQNDYFKSMIKSKSRDTKHDIEKNSINHTRLFKYFRIPINLGYEIWNDAQEKLTFLDKKIEFDDIVEVYEKWKPKFVYKIKPQSSLFSFILYMFLVLSGSSSLKKKCDSFDKLVNYYHIYKDIPDFKFDNYFYNASNSFYGVSYENARFMLIEMYTKNDKLKFDDWVNYINRLSVTCGLPSFASDGSNKIKDNYSRLFVVVSELLKIITLENVLSLMTPEEKITYFLRINRPIDWTTIFPELSGLNIKKLPLILSKIETSPIINIDQLPPSSPFNYTKIVMQVSIENKEMTQTISRIYYNAGNFIDNEDNNEKVFADLYPEIVFWSGQDVEEMENIFPVLYRSYYIMNSLGLMTQNPTKDNKTMKAIQFLISIYESIKDDIFHEVEQPKKENIQYSDDKIQRKRTRDDEDEVSDRMKAFKI
jgi:hypothetical protein